MATQNSEIVYKIPGQQQDDKDPARKLSHIFYIMNEMLNSGLIADFQVTRSSLEHVFIQFAKFQLNSGSAPQPGPGSATNVA